MPAAGTPAGFDLATLLPGSVLTLPLSAGIMQYGDGFRHTPNGLHGSRGGVLARVGVSLGFVLIARGLR